MACIERATCVCSVSRSSTITRSGGSPQLAAGERSGVEVGRSPKCCPARRTTSSWVTFPATDFGALFDGTTALAWEEWLPRDAEFPVKGRSHRSQLSSVPACQKIVKRAVVERLRQAYRTQELPETGPRCTLEVSLRDDLATLTLDTTGVGLHKRGYRRLVGEAQLRETLAAVLVQLSYWRPGRVLADPFCGTGTIPIEAALIGRNIAPGLKRDFGGKIAFHGGICTQHTLPFGTPRDVEEAVLDRVATLGAGGGYILASSHDISADTPPENILAMYKPELRTIAR